MPGTLAGVRYLIVALQVKGQAMTVMSRADSPKNCIAVLAACLLAGCASQWTQRQSSEDVHAAPPGQGVNAVEIEPCVDRTNGVANRDIGKDATKALRESIAASKVFYVREDAPHRLTCDVERYVEGSATQRWLLPGSGGTVADVAVSVWDAKTGAMLITERSQAAVKSGGLYTVGAEETILRAAFDDSVKKLAAWAQGTPASSTK
jgi:hypothetical protein